ncbi:efflux RND transporter periplasmic adaptor subunit [Undibacterium pigrum]|uniref:RND family efflux transporter MFP subunit n=1 Tax=Undibacterium pigrum TaxID=401470 RepID=A0A318ISE0_9BURK|nr:efflux RND transporter periplasmic adaptor subunit [Undibacterium pigrum]PXX37291.1 RND family efflux transporter MFP subunit [Undibacterium pigrum]
MISRSCTSLAHLVTKQVLVWATVLLASQVVAASLDVVEVRSSLNSGNISADGVVEAVRQTVIAAQVSGAITDLPVKAGDSIKAGQMLARLDGSAASQQANASQARVEAARASLQVASKDYERQKQLFSRLYISQAQLDRAEAQFNSATADANSLIAQAGAVQTQSGFYKLTAPYTGRIADVYISHGDMVTPGKALMAVFDPRALRVTATLPEAQLARLAHDQAITIEIPALPAELRLIKVDKFIILPVTDASTHTVQLRLDLPPLNGLAPGMFARLQFPAKAMVKSEDARLYVPVKAVIRRAELHAVYVINPQGRAMLRQIKPGPLSGSEQEVLAGVSAGEKVLINPLAAAQPH